MGLVSALGQCSNGQGWDNAHEPKMRVSALSCPRPLLHCPSALKPHNA